RRNNGAVDDRVDLIAFQLRALQQLGDAQLAQLDRGQILERGPRLRERRADTRDDRHASAIGSERDHGVNLTAALVCGLWQWAVGSGQWAAWFSIADSP